MNATSILHLTDIHAGPSAYTDVDGKVEVAGAGAPSLLQRLTNYLEALPEKPDYVAISGDITNRGDKAGLEEFRTWLIAQTKDGLLPDAKRILIVPGNHDVIRRNRIEEDDRKRFEPFWTVFGKAFPHPNIPSFDPDTSIPTIAPDQGGLIGGVETTVEAGEVKLTGSLPFILDLDRDVLIYGFNSAHGCGYPLKPDKAIVDPLRSVASLSNEQHKSALQKVETAYLDSLIVDAGMITPNQLARFTAHMIDLRKHLGRRFDAITKIAVLHHHISHLWEQQLEVKVFESVIDAAALKQALIEYSFDIVLHGHKHTNHVGIDASLIPVDQKERFSPLCVISGGTVGAFPRTNDHQSFKVIELAGLRGPRSVATVREIPLKPSYSPINIINHDSRIFNIALTDRFAHLHDIKTVKDAIDADLVDRLASELNAAGTLKLTASSIATAGALFSDTFKYKCYAHIDGKDGRIFYEVIQATRALKFGTIARLRWLVTELLGSTQKGIKIVILVGNLEDTHYSEALANGEAAKSIDDLRSWLSPAIQSGAVEVRSHAYAQKAIADIVTGAKI